MKGEIISRQAMYQAGEHPNKCNKCGRQVNKVIAKWRTQSDMLRKRECQCRNIFITRVSLNPAINAVNNIKM